MISGISLIPTWILWCVETPPTQINSTLGRSKAESLYFWNAAFTAFFGDFLQPNTEVKWPKGQITSLDGGSWENTQTGLQWLDWHLFSLHLRKTDQTFCIILNAWINIYQYLLSQQHQNIQRQKRKLEGKWGLTHFQCKPGSSQFYSGSYSVKDNVMRKTEWVQSTLLPANNPTQ